VKPIVWLCFCAAMPERHLHSCWFQGCQETILVESPWTTPHPCAFTHNLISRMSDGSGSICMQGVDGFHHQITHDLTIGPHSFTSWQGWKKVYPSTTRLANSMVELSSLPCTVVNICMCTRSKKDKTTGSGRHAVLQGDTRD
jgi:hypothetical protein